MDDQDIISNFQHPDFHRLSHENFSSLESNAFFAATSTKGHNVISNTSPPKLISSQFGLAKSDLEVTAREGYASIIELPIEAALSLNFSEQYRPNVILVLPSRENFDQHIDTVLSGLNQAIVTLMTTAVGDENEIMLEVEKLKNLVGKFKKESFEQFLKLQDLAINNTGLFSIIIEPCDLDVLVDFLSNNLDYSYSPNNTRQGNHTRLSDADYENMSNGYSPTKLTNISLTDMPTTSNVLPKDVTARRQSLAQQARRKTLLFEHAAVNKNTQESQLSKTSILNRRHTIGSNVVFDLAADSIARRTEKALAAISGLDRNKLTSNKNQSNMSIFEQEMRDDTMKLLEDLHDSPRSGHWRFCLKIFFSFRLHRNFFYLRTCPTPDGSKRIFITPLTIFLSTCNFSYFKKYFFQKLIASGLCG